MHARLNGGRAGVALPMAILLIGFITAGIIGAFARMTGESRTLDGGRTTTLAFALAERGLEARAATGDTLPDSVRYTFPRGFADVLVTRVRAGLGSTDTTLWLIRATGWVNGARPGRPAARRAVAQFAVRTAGTLDADAAWTSLSGLRKNGGAGLISGVNECNPADSVAGAAVPGAMFELRNNGGKYPFEGDPAVYSEGSQTSFAGGVGIDWGAVIGDPPAITPDIVCAGGQSASTCLPSFTNPDYYPVIMVNGDFTMGSNDAGRGLLIVKGRLTFTGGQETWRGLILVGQELIDNGTGYISGAVISGLDVKLGIDVPESEVIEEAVANGTKTYRYNSCEIANALNGAAKLALIPNAWMDNWSTW